MKRTRKKKSKGRLGSGLVREKLIEMLEQVEVEWQMAKAVRSDEEAISLGVVRFEGRWLMVGKLPSGMSFSFESPSEEALLLGLGELQGKIQNEDDLYGLLMCIRGFAAQSINQEIKGLVEECFGPCEDPGRLFRLSS